MYLKLGVRSLANASRARQFNPLNPPGVGWVPLPQTNMAAVVGRAWSCVVVRGRAWLCVVVRGCACAVVRGRARSCVRGRSFVVICGHSWSFVVIRGRAWSCAVGRAWSCVVVRGRSCVVVPFCPLRGQHGSQHCRAARFAASTAVTRTNERRKERRKERTTSNNPLNPPGVGWVNFFYHIKVRVSMGTCVPNLGAIRRPVRKFGLSNL